MIHQHSSKHLKGNSQITLKIMLSGLLNSGRVFVWFGQNNAGMNKLMIFLLVFLMTSVSSMAFSQDRYFDSRLIVNKVDCTQKKISLDIQIKAADSGESFFLASQNFRFSFNEDAVNKPEIEKELEVSGLVEMDGEKSFYGPHTMKGSRGNLVSYNVVLSAGKGILISENNWVSVGRISFDILDLTKCMKVNWHKIESNKFPKTIVVGSGINGLYKVKEGKYSGEIPCFSTACNAEDRAMLEVQMEKSARIKTE